MDEQFEEDIKGCLMNASEVVGFMHNFLRTH